MRQRKPRSTTPAGSAANGARTAPGATKTSVLAALGDGNAMTAGEIATATGLGRPTVSTTLSRLAKTSELTKVARGYQIASPASQAPPDASPDATPS
ncbi:MAG: MarR family transcriptional regulator [Solirubrobacteraceae bacterium]